MKSVHPRENNGCFALWTHSDGSEARGDKVKGGEERKRRKRTFQVVFAHLSHLTRKHALTGVVCSTNAMRSDWFLIEIEDASGPTSEVIRITIRRRV